MKLAWVLLVFSIFYVYGAYISGYFADISSEWTMRIICIIGYFMVVCSAIVTVAYVSYPWAFITAGVTGFIYAAMNTIILSLIAKRINVNQR